MDVSGRHKITFNDVRVRVVVAAIADIIVTAVFVSQSFNGLDFGAGVQRVRETKVDLAVKDLKKDGRLPVLLQEPHQEVKGAVRQSHAVLGRLQEKKDLFF